MYHPIHFKSRISYDRPTPIHISNRNLVIWRSKEAVNCFEDRCPHRGAQLSQGKILENKIQCGYHGWQFDPVGICTTVPQAKPGQYLPKACNVKAFDTFTKADIVWAELDNKKTQWPHPRDLEIDSFNRTDHFVTDYILDANYGFLLQIENLLDPAHIHFVHDGFQGDQAKAKFIRAKYVNITETKMEAVFTHDDDLVPDIQIVYHMPAVVEVSIFNKKGKIIRKNIIYVAPVSEGHCRVLFRDVAYKKYLTPPIPSIQQFLNRGFVEDSYQTLNQAIIESIMQQDVKILESQQKTQGTGLDSYLTSQNVLLTEADTLILSFRKWCLANRDLLKEFV